MLFTALLERFNPKAIFPEDMRLCCNLPFMIGTARRNYGPYRLWLHWRRRLRRLKDASFGIPCYGHPAIPFNSRIKEPVHLGRKMRLRYLNVLLFLGVLLVYPVKAQTSEWEPLLDAELSKWDVFMGVPHHTVKGLGEVPKGDGMKGTPLGLNNDPLQVFSTESVEGDLVLHISGEIYGGLTSKEVYENYHLKFDFKWGEKKWEPRLNDKRDNGLLYHCNGAHGAFWNVWMESQEFQIQEGDMGDYFGLAGGVNTIRTRMNKEDFYAYDPDGRPTRLGIGIEGKNRYRAVKKGRYEKPNGEWNTLELVCYNGKSFHIVNGHVVMILEKAERHTEEGYETVTKGRIQLQSEAAEAYYRNIQVRKIAELPEFLR